MMKKKKSFFRQLVHRYDQESPEFFKRTFRFGRVMVAGAASLLVPDLAFPDVKIPPYLITFAGYIGVAGVAIMAVSKAATKKEDEEAPPAEKQTEDE